MDRPRAPEDGPPRCVRPVYPETSDSIRYELPVTVGGVKGLVVIRWFVGRDEGDASIRGKAADLLERGR